MPGRRRPELSDARREVRERARHHGMSTSGCPAASRAARRRRRSDVDLLVDVEPGVVLFAVVRLQDELEALLGVPVDLVPADGAKPDVRRAVERELVSL